MQQVTELYLPNSGNRLHYPDESKTAESDDQASAVAYQGDSDFPLPHGILDCAKSNVGYVELLDALEVSSLSYEDILEQFSANDLQPRSEEN